MKNLYHSTGSIIMLLWFDCKITEYSAETTVYKAMVMLISFVQSFIKIDWISFIKGIMIAFIECNRLKPLHLYNNKSRHLMNIYDWRNRHNSKLIASFKFNNIGHTFSPSAFLITYSWIVKFSYQKRTEAISHPFFFPYF